MKDTIEAEDAKAALMKDKYGIAAIFRKYANANLYDPEVRDNILEYFIERIYVYDDRLIIQTDLVDYVGDCRHEAPWAFGDYDVGFARELEFDYFAFSSTIRYRAPREGRTFCLGPNSVSGESNSIVSPGRMRYIRSSFFHSLSEKVMWFNVSIWARRLSISACSELMAR